MTTARAFRILGWAHIRGHRNEYIAMFVISLALGLVKAFIEMEVVYRRLGSLGMDYSNLTVQYQVIINVLGTLLYFSIPGLFLYSILSDRKSGRNLLLYQLPCRNALPVFVTMLLTVSIGSLLWFFSYAVYAAFVSEKWYGNSSYDEFLLFSHMLLLFGVIYAIEALTCVIKRNRSVFVIVFFLTVIFLLPVLSGTIQNYAYLLLRVHPGLLPFYNLSTIIPIVLPLGIGLLLAVAGCIITERYRDL